MMHISLLLSKNGRRDIVQNSLSDGQSEHHQAKISLLFFERTLTPGVEI